jgi:BirA family biotin operon repressor/biotin-[acetyl-CoA-carboxylase] ligase
MFDLSRLAASRLVEHIDYHEELVSTSDRALELAAQDAAPLPLLVLAKRQTGGRGRGVNRWWSSEGALTFTLALEAAAAQLPLSERARVALVVGLAVADALTHVAPAVEWQVKWPNDVYAQGGKVGGILCESVPGWPERLVVGIGINVNNSLEDAPRDVRGRARALCDLAHRQYDISEVLLAVLEGLDRRWRELLAGQHDSLAASYRQRCLLSGRTVTAQSGGKTVVGRCGGIDARGALVLHTESGPTTLLSATIDSWE